MPPGTQQEVRESRARGTVRFSNPSCDFSCGLALPFALRKLALSTLSDLHHQGETPLCPTNPWHLPFPRCRGAGADQGERSQPRGGPGPSTSFLCPPSHQNPNSVGRLVALEVSTMKQLRASLQTALSLQGVPVASSHALCRPTSGTDGPPACLSITKQSLLLPLQFLRSKHPEDPSYIRAPRFPCRSPQQRTRPSSSPTRLHRQRTGNPLGRRTWQPCFVSATL